MDYKFLPERNKKDEADAKNSPARKKILGKKKATRLSRAKVKRIKARRIGAEAAYQQFDEQERCRDLSSKFARQSAERTGGPIGDIRERYDAIALGFVAVRQRGSLLDSASAADGGASHLFRLMRSRGSSKAKWRTGNESAEKKRAPPLRGDAQNC